MLQITALMDNKLTGRKDLLCEHGLSLHISSGGKSILFDYLILFGYLCSVASKILSHTFHLAFYFYFPNILMVTCDIILYYRNRKLERENAGK